MCRANTAENKPLLTNQFTEVPGTCFIDFRRTDMTLIGGFANFRVLYSQFPETCIFFIFENKSKEHYNMVCVHMSNQSKNKKDKRLRQWIRFFPLFVA